MNKATTVRMPQKLIDEINEYAAINGIRFSTQARALIRSGLSALATLQQNLDGLSAPTASPPKENQ